MNNPTETAERIISDVCAGRPCLSACLARVRSAPPCAACPPQGAARALQVIRWAMGVLAAVVVTLLACRAFGDVECTWDGTQYSCSGVGDNVIIYPGDGVVSPDAVTNVYGCCTNCTAIPPQALSNLLLQVRSSCTNVYYLGSNCMTPVMNTRDAAYDKIAEIDGYQSSGYYNAGLGNVLPYYDSISNYLETVDNDQTRVVKSSSAYGLIGSRNKQMVVYANDAIYLYANQYEKPQLQSFVGEMERAEDYLYQVQEASIASVDLIDSILPQLAKAPECGGSSSNSCNAVTGNWCTYDQGNAMLDLFREQLAYIVAISNKCHQINLHLGGLYRTFMNLRGGIPAESSLDKSWQDIYLSNSTGSFDYGHTNVAERIELLLYGLSGVGTNTQLFTSLDSPIDSDDTAQSEYDRVHAEFEDIDSSFDTGFVNMHSLFGKLQSLFSAFSGLVGRTLAPDETYISNFSFNLGDDSIAVPAVTVGRDVGIANQLQTICRGGMIGLYWLVAGILGVKFYIWFFAKVVYFLRWCWELLQGLFS